MVMFKQVDPASLDTNRLGRRGRVSYPLLKSFMEANMKLAQLDTTGYEKNPTYLRSVLTAYVNSHNLPIKIFAAQGNMYLMRLDLNNDGTLNESYKGGAPKMGKLEAMMNGDSVPGAEGDEDEDLSDRPTEGAAGHLRGQEPRRITSEEVESRFAKEKGQITK